MKVFASLMGVVCLLCGTTASAKLVTVDFTGTIQSVATGLGGTVVSGEAISGAFTYDSAIAAALGSSTGAEFEALQSITVHIGALTETVMGSHSILTGHAGSMDFFQVLADSTVNASTVFTGGALNNLRANDFVLNDALPFGSLFTDASHLPGSISGVGDPNLSFFQLGFGGPSTGSASDLFVLASLNSLTTEGGHSVPEPDSFTLLLLGIAGVGFGMVSRNRGTARLPTTGDGLLAG